MRVRVVMRVLHVLPTRTIEYGGPVAVAEEIVEELCHQGIDASLYPFSRGTPRDGRGGITGAREAWTKIRDAVSRNDMVHVHGLWNFPATVAARAAREAGIPYVITPHGMLDRWALRKSRLKKTIFGVLFERKNLLAASGLHFLNAEEAEEAKDYRLSSPVFILPNGVHAERFTRLPDRTSFERRYPQCRTKILALFLGRLHPKKGFDLLLPALSRAAASIPELHLLIAGPDEGGYMNVLLEMVKRNNLLERITFMGMVQGSIKLEALGAADFFVLPSYQEGDSVAVKEAMASRLPVVITPACHFPEIKAFNAGLVVQPNEDELCQALETLASGKCDRTLMGTNAVHLVTDRYTWPKIIERLLRIYEDILAGKTTSHDWHLQN
jgi:glycosyltransferase involved in cell wall biosynthesis